MENEITERIQQKLTPEQRQILEKITNIKGKILEIIEKKQTIIKEIKLLRDEIPQLEEIDT